MNKHLTGIEHLFLPHELDLLDGLDEFQSKYVFAPPNGVKQVTASAGSGKSHSMIGRALYLIRRHNVAPASITLLAFNNKAAGELKDRWHKLQRLSVKHAIADKAKEYMSAEGESMGFEISFDDAGDSQWSLGEINISTLHGFGYASFRRLPEFSEAKFSILSEYSSIKMFRQVVKEIVGDKEKLAANDVAALYFHIEDLASKNYLPHLLSAPMRGGPSVLQQIWPNLEHSAHGLPLFRVNATNLDAMHAGILSKSVTAFPYSATELGARALEALVTFPPLGKYSLTTETLLLILQKFYLDKYMARCLSFSDMLLYPLMYCTFNPVARQTIGLFSRTILCDESQDLDPLQFSMLATYFTEALELTGDVKQTLYSWRSANPYILEHLGHVVKNLHREELASRQA